MPMLAPTSTVTPATSIGSLSRPSRRSATVTAYSGPAISVSRIAELVAADPGRDVGRPEVAAQASRPPISSASPAA